jgi:hypothetical protein
MTYGNDCERLMAGVALDHAGACENECPDPNDPDVNYIGESPAECAAMLFQCDEGWTPFFSSCGCGCIKQQMCGGIGGLLCPEGQICDVTTCAFDASGVCVFAPDACADVLAPVCGCNGVTYDNDCYRLTAGAAFAYEGECESDCPDPNDPDVNYIGESPAECAAMMFTCDEGWMPFFSSCGCGCMKQKTCGGIGGLLCPEGQICDITFCAFDASGVCVFAPDACADILAPVCGCNGVTYDNDCYRLLAGAAFAYEGACEEPPCPDPDDPNVSYISQDPQECATMMFDCVDPGWTPFSDHCGCGCILEGQACGGIAGLLCPEDMICDIRFCAADAGGICVPEPDACYELLAPVCDCYGVTHDNDCYRLLSGAPLNHEGPCF